MKGNIQVAFIVLMISLAFFGGCTLNDTEKYIEKLKSENITVQSEALLYFGEAKERNVVPLIIELLKPDNAKEVRLKAVEALGKIDDSRAVEPLIGVLADSDKDIRKAVVEALGKVKDPEAVDPLISVLNDEDVQLAAIWALGNIGDKRAVPVLTGLLSSPDKYVRYNVVQSLKRIGSGRDGT